MDTPTKKKTVHLGTVYSDITPEKRAEDLRGPRTVHHYPFSGHGLLLKPNLIQRIAKAYRVLRGRNGGVNIFDPR